jgi:DNA-binding transcriptional MerR regulator
MHAVRSFMLASSRSSLRPTPATVLPGVVGEEPRTFSSLHLADAIGITLRQLQWWDERNLVRPSKSSHRRFWSMHDAVLCCIVARLRDADDSLQMIRKLIVQIRSDRRIMSAIADHSQLWIIVGRKQMSTSYSLKLSARFAFSEKAVTDDVKISDQYFLLISIHELVDQLESQWKI